LKERSLTATMPPKRIDRRSTDRMWSPLIPSPP
jgi:hypothetical protein